MTSPARIAMVLAARLARNSRRRRAAERGARTVQPYGTRTVDMGAFEKQFGGTTP